MPSITQSDAQSRLVTRDDYSSCSVAFIDCKKPGSHLKENYSIIGPGVTSSSEQVVNLPEPHGFNVGAAAMPNGITNNLHIHFTAEVFVVQKGEWTFRWGSNGENTFVGKEGDILTVPTWIFRGFTNTGPDDGWLFTVLGKDNTGGVIFHPEIIEEAAEYGLYLTKDNELIDVSKGDEVPSEDKRMVPMPADEVAKLREVTPEEMRSRLVAEADRDFKRGFIDESGAELAPVLGFGLTQNREHVSPVTNPHGFSIEWLRMAAGTKTAAFSVAEKMVVIVRKGKIALHMNDAQDVTIEQNAWETYAVPAAVPVSFEALGDEGVEALIILEGDGRKYPQFSQETLDAARANGLALDASGFFAKADLLPNYKRAG